MRTRIVLLLAGGLYCGEDVAQHRLHRYISLKLVGKALRAILRGFLTIDPATGRVRCPVLNAAAPLTADLVQALRALLAPMHVAVTLGET